MTPNENTVKKRAMALFKQSSDYKGKSLMAMPMVVRYEWIRRARAELTAELAKPTSSPPQ